MVTTVSSSEPINLCMDVDPEWLASLTNPVVKARVLDPHGNTIADVELARVGDTNLYCGTVGPLDKGDYIAEYYVEYQAGKYILGYESIKVTEIVDLSEIAQRLDKIERYTVYRDA